MKLTNQRGFSLVELMIVVAIIGILSAIAIPNFMRFQAKSRQAEAKANLGAIYAAEKAFNAEWQQYFGDLIEIGYAPEGSFRYEHGFAAGGVNGPATYTKAALRGAAPVVTNSTGCGAAPAVADIDPGAATVNCSVDRTVALNAPVSQAAAATFSADASGNIDNDAGTDDWTINESKQIFGPCSALPCTAAGMTGGDLDN